MNIGVLFAFNAYITNLYEDANSGKGFKRLKAVNYLGIIGFLMLIVSQFTGLYYTFDASNSYQFVPDSVLVPAAYRLCYTGKALWSFFN